MRSDATRPSARSTASFPIVEAEVMTDGTHTIERCEKVTGAILREVVQRAARSRSRCSRASVLKPNMVVPGAMCPVDGDERGDRDGHPALPAAVRAGGRPRHRVPLRRPGSVRSHRTPERDQPAAGPKPWKLTFSLAARSRTRRSAPGEAGRRTGRGQRVPASGRCVACRRWLVCSRHGGQPAVA